MKRLLDCLGRENEEGADVANQSETSNGAEEYSLDKEGECI